MISPEYLTHTPEIIATIGTLTIALAFSLKTRKEIGKRDKWTCQADGCDDGSGNPKSFQGGWMVHASHKNHNKSDPMYDHQDMGEILCIEHHLAYHQSHIGKAEEIGLCEDANNYAIAMLFKTNHIKGSDVRI